jgi:hypothetical protein
VPSGGELGGGGIDTALLPGVLGNEASSVRMFQEGGHDEGCWIVRSGRGYGVSRVEGAGGAEGITGDRQVPAEAAREKTAGAADL